MVVEDGTKKVFQFWGKTWWDKSHSALLNYNEPPTWETNFLEETKKRGLWKKSTCTGIDVCSCGLYYKTTRSGIHRWCL